MTKNYENNSTIIRTKQLLSRYRYSEKAIIEKLKTGEAFAEDWRKRLLITQNEIRYLEDWLTLNNYRYAPLDDED